MERHLRYATILVSTVFGDLVPDRRTVLEVESRVIGIPYSLLLLRVPC